MSLSPRIAKSWNLKTNQQKIFQRVNNAKKKRRKSGGKEERKERKKTKTKNIVFSESHTKPGINAK